MIRASNLISHRLAKDLYTISLLAARSAAMPKTAASKTLSAFSKTKREYAYQFGVDAYTDNEKLQDRLDEISWAGYAGGLTWAAVMSATKVKNRGPSSASVHRVLR